VGGEEFVFWIRGSIVFSAFFFFCDFFKSIIEVLLMVLRNRGRRRLRFRKPGANMQSLKSKGKRAVTAQNKGSYAIYPIFIVLVSYTIMILLLHVHCRSI